jgi:hypothetical protein
MRNDYNLLKRINEQGEKKARYDDVDCRRKPRSKEKKKKKKRKKKRLTNKFAFALTRMEHRMEQE